MIRRQTNEEEKAIFTKNRMFYERQRAKYYLKARENLLKLGETSKESTANISISFLYENIRDIAYLINECVFYSKQALFGYGSGDLPVFSKEHPNGVLEEEKIFLYIMQELEASVVCLDRYVASESKLLNYKNNLSKYKANPASKHDGYINNIMKKIDRSFPDQIVLDQLNFLYTRVKALDEIHKMIINMHGYVVEDSEGYNS